LLDAPERRLFRRLSTFVGGYTVSALELVCNAGGDLGIDVLDGVESLLDKSLIREAGLADVESRFGMLETIREYGLEQLDASGEGPELRDRHLDYYLSVAEAADAGLVGADQVRWCDRLEADHDNIRAAFAWVLAALDANVDPTPGLTRATSRLEAGIRLVDAMELFWMLRGHVRENWPGIMSLVEWAPQGSENRAQLLVVAGSAAHSLLDLDTAIRLGDEALDIWQDIGDPRGIASALARRGVTAISQGDPIRAEAWLTDARSLFLEGGGERQSGIEHPVVAFLAQAVQDNGNHERAYRLYEEAVTEARDRGDRHAAAYALRHLGRLHLAQNQIDHAIACLREGLPDLLELKDRRCTPPCLEALAYAFGRRDQSADAARLFAAAGALRDLTGMPLMPNAQAHQESELALLQLRLGLEPFRDAWTEGRMMGLDEAINYALNASLDRGVALHARWERVSNQEQSRGFD
jgi:non-specific serine/threonine protein kinase